MLEDPNQLITTILIGNNIVNIGASSLATFIATDLFGSKGVGIATGVMTLLILVFGEITPKKFCCRECRKVGFGYSQCGNIFTNNFYTSY